MKKDSNKTNGNTDLEIIRNRIRDMFSSPDKELRRLAQKLCHKYRINYWLALWRSYKGGKFVPESVIKMGLDDIYVKGTLSDMTEVRITRDDKCGFNGVEFHEIKLKKHDNRRKD